ARFQAQLDKVQASMNDYTALPEYQAKLAEKEEIQRAIEGDEEAVKPQIDRLQVEIARLDKAISVLSEQKATVTLYEQTQLRLKELELQEEALAAEFEKLERE